MRQGERRNKEDTEKKGERKSKLFTLANPVTSFKQVKGFMLFGQSTFDSCQHLKSAQFEKGPIFLGSQRRVGLLTTAGNRRCGIRVQEGGRQNLSFPSNCFLPLFQCKIQAAVPLNPGIMLLGGVSLSEVHLCL